MPSSELIVQSALDQGDGDPFVFALLRTWLHGERGCALPLLAECCTDVMVRIILGAEGDGTLTTGMLLAGCAAELCAADLIGDDRRVAQAKRWGQAHLEQLRRRKGDLAA